MITKERLIELICSYAEGATDNVADGVLYNSLASAILLELQLNGAKPDVKCRFSVEEFIWSKVFPTEPYNADDYYDWARENANHALELSYEYCFENGI